MPADTPLADLTASLAYLPTAFREGHAPLFRPDLLERLASRLAAFYRDGVPPTHPPPHFAAERTPPPESVYRPFAAAMRARADTPGPAVAAAFAEALVAAGAEGVLVLLGQRLTPASVTGLRAAPPTAAELVEAAARPYQPGQGLSAAARALDKHVGRAVQSWWGPVVGPVGERNQRAAAVVRQLLDGATWWNVFGHFLHGLVYEARLPSGHGARWELNPLRFIGFLEPFDQDGDSK